MLDPAPPPERELTLCLVMYGGMSLAVYMNGVAREYFDLVRGRGVWGIFKRLAAADAVVDVISGPSEGGLNGLFLAYAICGHREFGTMVDLWRNRASIEALLADPATPGLHSLLKGEYMENELKNAFETMPPGKTAWYIDGGVLDNKPFTCALPMIYQRHADRPIDRMLFFVEPDPEADDKVTPAEGRAAEPNFLETALASLSSLPSYESILDEIRGDRRDKGRNRYTSKSPSTSVTSPTTPPPDTDTPSDGSAVGIVSIHASLAAASIALMIVVAILMARRRRAAHQSP